MFGSEVLDIAIGLVLLFLFLSLICTAIIEVLEAVLKHRAMDLERGIRELLDDRDGSTIARTFFAHPLVYGLYAGDYDPAGLRETRKFAKLWRWLRGSSAAAPLPPAEDADQAEERAAAPLPLMRMSLFFRRELPSYIPAGNFSAALLDIVARGAVDPATPPALGAPTAASLRAGVLALPNLRLQRAVLAALDASHDDLAQAKASLEAWYDSAMDRVSGWYKRRTQWVLFAVGLLMAGILNIDAVTVARRLHEDEGLRKAAIAQAERMTGDDRASADANFDGLVRRIEAVGYPMGWNPRPQLRCEASTDSATPKHRPASGCKTDAMGAAANAAMVGGWLISALAVMLGAPFWFDLLNKLMVIRATVKPREKSREEGSEDRPAAVSARGDGTGAAPTGAVGQDTSGRAPGVPQIPFQPHEWKDRKEEGIL